MPVRFAAVRRGGCRCGGRGVVAGAPVEAQESSTSLTVTPSSGGPGTPVVIGGVACCPGEELVATLYWTPTNEAIGTLTVATDGTATGSATIPSSAEYGIGYVSTCGPGTHDACTMTAAFEVAPPTLSAEPAAVGPGGAVHLSGDRWCCEGGQGAVTDLYTAREWGTATVGAANLVVEHGRITTVEPASVSATATLLAGDVSLATGSLSPVDLRTAA